MGAHIEVEGIGRDYRDGQTKLTVLDGVDLEIHPNEIVAITGPSGSGKSTLLALLAGLDRPSRGRVTIDDVTISELDEDALSRFRGRHIGFIFQSFQLIDTLTAVENVRVPAELLGDFTRAAEAAALLERVGLGHRLTHYPSQLSGGEMQRVAIARASIVQPSVLLADEPTGNLDSRAGERVLELLFERRDTATVVVVTHDASIAERADREVRLADGRIAEVIERRAS